MHQVGFTQAYATVQEKWVVAMLRVVGNLPGGGPGQLVRFTFDKGFEGERTVQIAGVLERTLHLNVALFGTTRRNRCRSAVQHRIIAVSRRRLGHLGRLRRLRRRHRDRVSNSHDRRGGWLRVGLRKGRSHCSADRGIGRGPRCGAATATY
ncbi:hypothetical protein D3C81_1431220 [compost metagenome]